jgi:hypothetical protein
MLDPYRLPLGHRGLCPCDGCHAVRECWASRQPPLIDGLSAADAEDSTDNASTHEELSDATFRR